VDKLWTKLWMKMWKIGQGFWWHKLHGFNIVGTSRHRVMIRAKTYRKKVFSIDKNNGLLPNLGAKKASNLQLDALF